MSAETLEQQPIDDELQRLTPPPSELDPYKLAVRQYEAYGELYDDILDARIAAEQDVENTQASITTLEEAIDAYLAASLGDAGSLENPQVVESSIEELKSLRQRLVELKALLVDYKVILGPLLSAEGQAMRARLDASDNPEQDIDDMLTPRSRDGSSVHDQESPLERAA